MLRKLNGIRNKEEGFTLVELLIVVAIIAILAAIAIPQFSKYKKRAYVATLNADIKNAYTAASAYLTDFPSATVDDLPKLLQGGYTPSENVALNGAGTMTLDSGSISLDGGFPINKNSAEVTWTGVVTAADDLP